MAKESGNRSDAELKEQIGRSREDLALRLNRVREEVDLPRKIRRSIRREPVPWIIGAIAVGLLVTAVVTRKKKVIVDAKGGTKSRHALLEAGFVLGALRIAASLLKPVVMNFVEKKLGSYSSRDRPGPKGF
ncbi:MAG TPA: hypothetical protein VN827_06340 [Chthoniobacterales bacterium]|jgi:hypothetical protein|nr:hypothetical protein [Chthoniobacterales bacterium]